MVDAEVVVVEVVLVVVANVVVSSKVADTNSDEVVVVEVDVEVVLGNRSPTGFLLSPVLLYSMSTIVGLVVVLLVLDVVRWFG